MSLLRRNSLLNAFRLKKYQDIVIKMFDQLNGRVHMANQNGLQNLQKN